MKRNFLVTTGLIETWEFNENNFILGKWCEFYETNDLDKGEFKQKIQKSNIIKNTDHWDDNKKQTKDYEYINKKLEYLLEIITEKLSIVHNVDENKEYWRVIIYNWLDTYTTLIFDRWENIRIFFEKNKATKFYSNFISLNDSDYIPINQVNFTKNSQTDEWNHLIFLRLFHFLNIQNLSLIKKKIIKNNLKKVAFSMTQISSLQNTFVIRAIKLIDNMISKLAFKFNKIIIESFIFPKKEYLKICLRCKLIPTKYSNFFDFDSKKNNLSNSSKRIAFRDLLLKVDMQDKFIQFLLLNIHKDMPKSYLEDFDMIKKKFLPFAKKKKIIFSMHSLFHNDNFRIYIAETKKVGSKYIHAVHGGSLTTKINPYFDFIEKVSDKIIRWDNTEQKQNIYVNLSPTLPVVKLKKQKISNHCSIIFCEFEKYRARFSGGPGLDQSINFFNDLTEFVNQLNPEIKSKIKFRVKSNKGMNSEKKFIKIFGEKKIDEVSLKNPFEKTLLNSKLIIVTYPYTAFSQAMYSNIPTILIIKKNLWQFSTTALHTFNDLKKSKIAFEDFNEAKTHINKHWKELDSWWNCKDVQFARKRFLTNFFNVKSNCYREWSDYIYFSLSS